MSINKIFIKALTFAIFFSFLNVYAEEVNSFSDNLAPTQQESETAPKKVEVETVTEDAKIASRLTRILEATGWFQKLEVEVTEGIVFLRGTADSSKHQEWAGQLAGKTQDVVAVVNNIEFMNIAIWDFSQAWNELHQIAGDLTRNSPLILVGIFMLIVTWVIAEVALYGLTRVLKKRVESSVLRNIIAKAFAFIICLIGVYLVLRIFGLTRLAFTVIGSTGVLGLVIGFSFRDIAENFLASLLLSIQNPFIKGDLILVKGFEGYVQSVNTRTTLLMTRTGNHIQIPNAIIYKEIITNYTANPNMRFEFLVGISFDDSISEAQTLALGVLHEHKAVLKDPEPLILVNELGSSTVKLRVIYWTNITQFSMEKVRSAIIRLIKIAFEEGGITMPDEAREIIFPNGVPVQITPEEAQKAEEKKDLKVKEKADITEDKLTSDVDDIQQQANQSRNPEEGRDLLEKS